MDLSLANIQRRTKGCEAGVRLAYNAVRANGGRVTPALLRWISQHGVGYEADKLLTDETRHTIVRYLIDTGQLRPTMRWWSYYTLSEYRDALWPDETLQMIADICNDQED